LDSIAPSPDVETRPVVLFRVAGGMYGIDLTAIREIIPLRRATRLPGAPEHVRGLVNVRGTIVTVVDLGLRLGGAPVGADSSVMLVELGGKVAGAAVDEVLEVQRFLPEEIDPPGPEHAVEGIVTGVGHAAGSIVILLDIHSVIRSVLL
jgi:purine-binding chemotaxis protein CheW